MTAILLFLPDLSSLICHCEKPHRGDVATPALAGGARGVRRVHGSPPEIEIAWA